MGGWGGRCWTQPHTVHLPQLVLYLPRQPIAHLGLQRPAKPAQQAQKHKFLIINKKGRPRRAHCGTARRPLRSRFVTSQNQNYFYGHASSSRPTAASEAQGSDTARAVASSRYNASDVCRRMWPRRGCTAAAASRVEAQRVGSEGRTLVDRVAAGNLQKSPQQPPSTMRDAVLQPARGARQVLASVLPMHHTESTLGVCEIYVMVKGNPCAGGLWPHHPAWRTDRTVLLSVGQCLNS